MQTTLGRVILEFIDMDDDGGLDNQSISWLHKHRLLQSLSKNILSTLI